MAAGYLAPGYRDDWGFPHYGHDLGFKEAGYHVYACGSGEVIAAGLDGNAPYGSGAKLGNCVVIVYRDVLCGDGVIRGLSCQMCHFKSIFVKAGQLVTADTVIGEYGNTGGRNYSDHLHIQFDTDVNYPRYMYGIAATGNVMCKGTKNTTLNPACVYRLREGQSVHNVGYKSSAGRDYVQAADLDMGQAVGGKRYGVLVGEYGDKAEARQMLSKAKDKGFANAAIVKI